MISFTATIKKFESQGDKTGWTYIEIPAAIAQKLLPNNKKSFRVKGKLDNYPFGKVALIPMGEGAFIMPINGAMRKGTKKQKGAFLKIKMEKDEQDLIPPPEFIECLQDEPVAFEHYKGLPKSHQHYFIRWIESAKTEPTKAKRIALSINAFVTGINFGQLLRSLKKEKNSF